MVVPLDGKLPFDATPSRATLRSGIPHVPTQLDLIKKGQMKTKMKNKLMVCSSSPFQQFEDLAGRLLAVPRKELHAKLDKYKQKKSVGKEV